MVANGELAVVRPLGVCRCRWWDGQIEGWMNGFDEKEKGEAFSQIPCSRHCKAAWDRGDSKHLTRDSADASVTSWETSQDTTEKQCCLENRFFVYVY